MVNQLICLMDKYLSGRLRSFYFDNIRGHFVLSYRLERVNLGEGTVLEGLWRWVVKVRKGYEWYEADELGNAPVNGVYLHSLPGYYYNNVDAALVLYNMVRGSQELRERMESTRLLAVKYRPYLVRARNRQPNTRSAA